MYDVALNKMVHISIQEEFKHLMMRYHHTVNTIKTPVDDQARSTFCYNKGIRAVNYTHFIYGGLTRDA